jgi:arginine utilization regulatory protein
MPHIWVVGGICLERLDNKIKKLEQENEALKKEIQLLRAIIDAVHECVFVVNEKIEIILYNTQAEKTEGLKREDILGKKEDNVYPESYCFSDEVTKRVLETGRPIIEQSYKYDLNDGRKINIVFSAFPFYYKDKIAAVYVIFRNMDQLSEFIAITIEMQKKFIREVYNGSIPKTRGFWLSVTRQCSVETETAAK